MSIVVAVRVGEGLVIAADSASTLITRGPDGQGGVAKVFNHATKLMQLSDYPIAVASWGSGNLGSRSFSSLVEEYANSLTPLGEDGSSKEQVSVKKQAEGVKDYLLKYYEKEYPGGATANPGVGLGVLVGGYSGREFFPEEYVFTIPDGEFVALRKPRPNGKQDFGANWYGLTDACVRLHHGRDDMVQQVLKDHGIDDDTVDKIWRDLGQKVQYPVPFDGMPLQDAVDYATYMVGVVVGRYRFVLGPELCGGPIDVATVTRKEGFTWIQRKELAARLFGPQI